MKIIIFSIYVYPLMQLALPLACHCALCARMCSHTCALPTAPIPSISMYLGLPSPRKGPQNHGAEEVGGGVGG